MELAVMTSIFRSFLQIIGTLLVAKGLLTEDEAIQLIGGGSVLFGVLWGVFKNSKYFPKVKV